MNSILQPAVISRGREIVIESDESQEVAALRNEIEKLKSTIKGLECIYVIKRSSREIGKKLAVVHEAFEKLMLYCQYDVPIALVGPAGCGKSTICEQVAEALNLPFAYINLSLGVTESAIKGKNPHGDYIPSKFVEMYENGGVFLLDEFDAADPNVLMTLNGALAGHLMDVPARSENPVAERHKDFIPIVAMNTFGHGADRIYTGRNQLDGATLDRFLQIELDYSPAIENSMGDARSRELVQFIRQVVKENSFRKVVSSRMITKASIMWECYPISTKLEIAKELMLGWGKQEIDTVLSRVKGYYFKFERKNEDTKAQEIEKYVDEEIFEVDVQDQLLPPRKDGSDRLKFDLSKWS